MKKVGITAWLLVLCSCVSMQAQEDSAHQIVPLTVVKGFNTSLSAKVIQNDSNIQKSFVQNSIADALVQNNMIHVKSYGTGLQTVAFRGTGAEHTAVFWEGIQLNSSMNGTVDFALLPSFFTNEVLINYGDGGAGVGNAAVGGTVHTGSKLNFKKQREVSLLLQSGSYDNNSIGVGFLRGSKRFVTSTKVYMHKAENDFIYQNQYKKNKPDERVRNNALNQIGVMQQLGYSWKHQYLKFSTIYLGSKRELYNTSSPSADETQEDRTLRSSLRYSNFISKSLNLNAMLGYSNEYLRYLDPTVEDSKYLVNAYLSKVRLTKKYHKSEVDVLYQIQSQNANSDNYEDESIRNEQNIALSIKKNLTNRFLSKTAVRGTLFNGRILPFNIGQVLSFNLSKKIQMSTSVNSIYRLPTFNELYWLGAGNKDLKPEKGWKQDLTTSFHSKLFDAHVSGFHILVDDWLIWLPNGTKWLPQNIRKVRSRGAEITLNKELKIQKTRLNLKGNYSFTKTTNEEVETGNEAVLGKQLINVPLHKASALFAIVKSHWTFTSYLNYSGESFSTSNNKNIMDSYTVLSSGISRTFKWKYFEGNLALSARNILDQRYEVLPGNPVPGRTFWIKLNLQINK